jgi:hypothetical protein
LEHVRREIQLGPRFSRQAFERAFKRFLELYGVRPLRASCSPDVLARYCALFERSEVVAHQPSGRVAYEGVPLVAAVLAPGTIVFEGEVEETRMGDW